MYQLNRWITIRIHFYAHSIHELFSSTNLSLQLPNIIKPIVIIIGHFQTGVITKPRVPISK